MAISGRRPRRPDGLVYRKMRRTRVADRTLLEGRPKRRGMVSVFVGAVRELVRVMRGKREREDIKHEQG